jgi:hypothetical protein
MSRFRDFQTASEAESFCQIRACMRPHPMLDMTDTVHVERIQANLLCHGPMPARSASERIGRAAGPE